MIDDAKPREFHIVSDDLRVARNAYPEYAAHLRSIVQTVPEKYWKQKHRGIEGFDRLSISNICPEHIDRPDLHSIQCALADIAMLPEIVGRKRALINRYAPGVNGPFLHNGPRPMSVVIFGLTEGGQLDYYPEYFPNGSHPESLDVGAGDIVDIENPYLLYRGADQTSEVRYSIVFYNRAD